MSLPRILLIATGGTIAGVADEAASTTRYQAGSLGAQALLDAVPEAFEIARFEISQPFNLDSCDLSPGHWLQLAREVAAGMADAQIDGILVSHGTDTLEETAFLLDRLIAPGKPLVLTCAMRPASAHSADGPLNLLHAVQAAAVPALGEFGTLVVVNERIHSGSWLVKRHTQALDAFDHEESAIGRCAPPRIECRRESPPRAPELLPRLGELPRVDVLWVGAGSEPDLLSSCIAHGARGLVLALPGNGSLPAAWKAAVGMALAKGVPVVRASRTGDGPVAAQAEDRGGLFRAGRLGPAQARVALMLALAAELPPQHFFC